MLKRDETGFPGTPVLWADEAKYWYKEVTINIRHRLDGPAIERADGTREWWVNHIQIDGLVLDLFKQAISTTTPSSKVGELSHHENEAIALGAVHSPNCPIEAQVEWTLTRGVGE